MTGDETKGELRPLTVQLFGPFAASTGTSTLDSGEVAQQTLLAYLLFRDDHTASAGTLAEQLLGSRDDEALEAVYTRVRRLRKKIGKERLITVGGGRYRLKTEFLTADVWEFEEATRRAGQRTRPFGAHEKRRLADAMSAYRPLLDGWNHPTEHRGESTDPSDHSAGDLANANWLSVWRKSLWERFLDVCAVLDFDQVESLLGTPREGSGSDWRLQAQAVTAWMRFLAKAGQYERALEAYDGLRDRKAANGEAYVLAADIRDRLDRLERISLGRASEATRPILDREPDLVGREALVANVGWQVAHYPLVVLVGAPGVGKTQLALHAAYLLRDEFHNPKKPQAPSGAVVIDLSGVSSEDALQGNPSSVASRVAATLRVPQQTWAGPVNDLLRTLGGSHVLLVLDNAEHVTNQAEKLAVALAGTGGVHVLVTTRTRGLGGNVASVIEVPNLPVPQTGEYANLDSFLENPTVDLFARRVRRRQPSYRITTEAAPLVERICRACDGIPLAVELVAAQMANGGRDIVWIAERWPEQSQLFSRIPRREGDRHGSVAAAVSWSYELLSEQARALLRRISVFRGTWTSALAQAVCSFPPLTDDQVVTALNELEGSSLISRVGGDETVRFRMLVPIRAAAEQIAWDYPNPDEAARAKTRHTAHYQALAADAFAAWDGSKTDYGIWFERLYAEKDDLESAIQRTADGEHNPAAIALAAHLWPYWLSRGLLRDGITAMEKLGVGEDSGPSDEITGIARMGHAILAAHLAQTEVAERQHAAARRIFKALGLTRRSAVSSNAFGIFRKDQGRYAEAREMLEEAVRLFADLGDEHRLSRALNNLGILEYETQNLEAARGYLRRAFEINERLGSEALATGNWDNLAAIDFEEESYVSARSVWEKTIRLHDAAHREREAVAAALNLGWTDLAEGKLDGAATWIRETLRRNDSVGDVSTLAGALTVLGRIAEEQGAADEARGHYREAYGLFASLEDRRYQLDLLDLMVCLHAAEGRPELAACLLGAVDHLRQQTTPPTYRLQLGRQWIETVRATVIEQLGAGRFAALVAVGSRMSLEQAAEAALAEAVPD